MQFDIPIEERSIIKVIGVGGGGCNAVMHMFNQGIVGVDFAVCNTDNQSMEMNPVPSKIQLGPHLTEGRGAGSMPQVGKQACIESIDEIRQFLEESTKMLFITAGMGGGTGTGAAPIIAKASKEMDILTVAIVTIPFKFEGKRRREQAIEGLEELKKNVDSLIIVSNDKLREIHGNLPISEAFGNADDILCTGARGIAEIITVPGHVNVDFEDVNTVMRDSGVSIMGTA
ncbi:MAG: cell division protein FtsZ, partial [Saprospiraceae bacterium]|nr:cell division protein FtsZ [Saprospiraceae bacterium]